MAGPQCECLRLTMDEAVVLPFAEVHEGITERHTDTRDRLINIIMTLKASALWPSRKTDKMLKEADCLLAKRPLLLVYPLNIP